jgi:long-chain acyl-CoA synthetase
MQPSIRERQASEARPKSHLPEWPAGPLPALRLEAHYGDRIVPCFADRPRSLSALLIEAAREPDREALVCGDARFTWQHVLEASRGVAAGLAARGLKPGDRIAMLVGNRPEFVLALFGATWLGAICVPLSTRQQRPEIAHALNDCGARLLIHEKALADRLPSRAEVPDLEFSISVGGAEPFGGLPHGSRGLAAAEVYEDDIAIILYTSGTTGHPKGAMLTHLNIVHSAMVYEHCMALTGRDRSIAAVPLAHVTGLIANIAAVARCGGTLVILPEFKSAEFLRIAARERITHTVMAPAMYNLALLQPDFERHDLASWRIGGYGGAPMPVPAIERLAEKLPRLALMNAYGATETTSPTTMMPPTQTLAYADSVGQPVPGATVIVVDDSGREVPTGEAGEIWIHGPSVVRGYWRNPSATAESFTAGFWHSGDVGSMDANGFIRVFDRKKDMIIRGGLKVYTAEVETVLAACPGVVESAVVPRPCPVLCERVHAFVVANERAVTAETLREFCAARLSDYKVPETFTLRREPLPRNANGKVMKRVLKTDLANLA